MSPKNARIKSTGYTTIAIAENGIPNIQAKSCKKRFEQEKTEFTSQKNSLAVPDAAISALREYAENVRYTALRNEIKERTRIA